MLPLLLVTGFLEYKLSKTPNSYKIKRASFEKQLDSIQILVLGGSESQRDILPCYLGRRAFNLSNVAQTFFYDNRITLKYLQKMPALRMVIIPLNYSAFYYELADTHEEWRDYYYYRFWGIKYPDMPFWDMKRYSFIALYSWPEVRKIVANGFENDYTKGDKELAYDGGLSTRIINREALEKRGAFNPDEAKSMIASMKDLINPARFQRNFNYLNTLVDSLSQRKIRVVLVAAPVSPNVYAYMNDTAFVADSIVKRSQDAIGEICKTYQCRYYDFSNDPRFVPTDFSHETHLRGAGVVRFSEILRNEVIEPNF